MTDIDARDLLAETPAPALRLLATAIDREFARREESAPSPYDHAAAQLGVGVTDLVVLTEVLEPPVAHAVGHWLFEAQLRWSAEHVGAFPTRPATSETVPGARGDVRAFNAVTMTLSAGTLAGVPVVVRLVPDRFSPEVELIGRTRDADGLPDVLDGFLRRCRTTDSPYRRAPTGSPPATADWSSSGGLHRPPHATCSSSTQIGRAHV